MTEPQTHDPAVDTRTGPPLAARPSVLRVMRDQRKIVGVAAALVVASFWVLGQLGQWQTASMVGVGVLLALANHLATELWLAKLIGSGQEPTRRRIAVSTFVRLLVLTVVAVTVAAAFWPNGMGLLLGLALFRLIALVMTTIPLLKELRNA
ncbi:MAG TPA: hypothetical protein VFQ11_03280 [Nocardioidaceae bacterium]|nr:hypothetical protein [Nocardioidaceae bacterium]